MYLSGHDHILSDERSYQGTKQLISGAASLNSDLGLPSERQQFTQATYGILLVQLTNHKGSITADYRFYGVSGPSRAGTPDHIVVAGQ